MKLCLDTSVLSYVLYPPPHASKVEEMRKWSDAQDLFSSAAQKGNELCIASPALAEVLLGKKKPAERQEALEWLHLRCAVLSFDQRCAEALGRMVFTTRHLRKLSTSFRTGKECMKVDWMIAACAGVWGASLCTFEPRQALFYSCGKWSGTAGPPKDFLKDTNHTLVR